MTTISRRPTTENRRTSIESDASFSSAQSHRLSSSELKTLQNDSTRHLLERMDEMQIEKAMEGLKVVKERRKSSITKKKKKSDSSNNGNDSRHNSNSNKKEASSATSLDINIAGAAASLNEHGEKSRRSGKGNSSSRGKSPNNVASSEEESNDAVPPLPLNGRKKQASSKRIQKDGPW